MSTAIRLLIYKKLMQARIVLDEYQVHRIEKHVENEVSRGYDVVLVIDDVILTLNGGGNES